MTATNPAAYGVLPIGAVAPYVVPTPRPEHCLFLSPQLSDAGTIVASSTLGSSLVAANLQNQEPTKKWRAAATSATLTLTLRVPAACNVLAFIGHNFSDVAVWRLKGAVSAAALAAGDLLIDTGLQSVWPVTGKPFLENWPHRLSLLRWTPAGAGLVWQLEIVDPGNADGYIEGGRLMLGVGWQPVINVDNDPAYGLVPLDVQEPTPYGGIFTDPRPWAQRQFDLNFSHGNEDDVHEFAAELTRLRGQAGDFVFCLDPAAGVRFHQWSLQALFAGRTAYRAVPLWHRGKQVWGFTASLIEKII